MLHPLPASCIQGREVDPVWKLLLRAIANKSGEEWCSLAIFSFICPAFTKPRFSQVEVQLTSFFIFCEHLWHRACRAKGRHIFIRIDSKDPDVLALSITSFDAVVCDDSGKARSLIPFCFPAGLVSGHECDERRWERFKHGEALVRDASIGNVEVRKPQNMMVLNKLRDVGHLVAKCGTDYGNG